MDISEQVLFSTLAQILKKDFYEGQKVERKQKAAMQVVQTPEEAQKRTVNRLEVLEYDLIKNLLLYGNRECIFTDTILVEEEDGTLKEEQVQQTLKIYEKIFLELQEDEIELANPDFKQIYELLMGKLSENPNYDVNRIANELPIELSEKVSGMLLDDDSNQLHDWSKRDIVPKAKDAHLDAIVSDIILNIRSLLVHHLIQSLTQQMAQANEEEKKELLENVMNYIQLQKLLAKRLNIVVNY
jgi:putative DNA primase